MWEANGYPDVGRVFGNIQLYKRMLALWKNYGMTLKEYDGLVEAQQGCCSLCGQPPKHEHKKLVIDHDHRTGCRRALLCDPCNRALGYLENEVWMTRASQYLQSFQRQEA